MVINNANLLASLTSTYEKVLLVNLKDGTFQEIVVNEDEQVAYKGLDQWLFKFANSNNMCTHDKVRFLKFANIENFKRILTCQPHDNIVYQRKIDGDYHWCALTIYAIEHSDKALLTVQDLQQYQAVIDEQKNRGGFKDRSALQDYALKNIANPESIGMIIFEYPLVEATDMAEIFNYYYDINNIYQYDSTHVIVVFPNISTEAFTGRLSQAYKEFLVYNAEIGSVWRSAGWDYTEVMSSLSLNLQINKPDTI